MNGRIAVCLLTTLAISAGPALADHHKLLERGAKGWKYLDTADGPGDGWEKPDFDDSSWKSGQAPLGYGDVEQNDVKQTLSFGDDESNKRISVYLRRDLDVKESASTPGIVGKLICDDGCAIFLNGEEIHRHNLPEGELKKDTTSIITIGGELERYEFTFVVESSKFKEGKNVIAVRVHQRGGESSDLAFDLSLTRADGETLEVAKATCDEEQSQLAQAAEQSF